MALTSHLNHQEWCLAFFSSFVGAAHFAQAPRDLSIQLRTGIWLATKAGFNSWSGLQVSLQKMGDPPTEEDLYQGIQKTQSLGDAASAYLVALLNGGLDLQEMSLSILPWVQDLPLEEGFKTTLLEVLEYASKDEPEDEPEDA